MEGTTATADSKEAEGTLGGEEVSGLPGKSPKNEGRKRKKTEREKERQRKKARKRIRIIKPVAASMGVAREAPFISSNSSFMEVVNSKGVSGKLHFLKGCFDSSLCDEIALQLDQCSNYWMERKDPQRAPVGSNGCRQYFIAGKWCAVGHFREGIDCAHWAKPVGVISEFGNLRLRELLAVFSCQATLLLRRYRPEIFALTEGLEEIFGAFHLFFAMRGVVRQHTDRNDVISFAFPIRSEWGAKGGLEIGGTSRCFSSKPGDAILMDSHVLSHGIPEYTANPSGRIVGVFSIQRTYLLLHGIKPPVLICKPSKENGEEVE